MIECWYLAGEIRQAIACLSRSSVHQKEQVQNMEKGLGILCYHSQYCTLVLPDFLFKRAIQ